MLKMFGTITDEGDIVVDIESPAELMALALCEDIEVIPNPAEGTAIVIGTGIQTEETEFFNSALEAIKNGFGLWVVFDKLGMHVDKTH